MKIINYDLLNNEYSIEKIKKSKDISDMIAALSIDESVINVYECDILYDNNNINRAIKNIICNYPQLANCVHEFVNNIPKNTIKKKYTGTSMSVQNSCNSILKELNKYNIDDFDINNINHIVIAALINKKSNNIINNYFQEHKDEYIDQEEIYEKLIKKYSFINNQKFIMLASKLDLNKFPSLDISRDGRRYFCPDTNLGQNLKLSEENNIPAIISNFLNYSMWGIHFIFNDQGKDKYLKYVIFHCFFDIIIFSFRKNSFGYSKLNFFIAIPNNEQYENEEARNRFINIYLQHHQHILYTNE